jgi:signal transduction histidine kinase/CheY-like chemotaxis protein
LSLTRFTKSYPRLNFGELILQLGNAGVNSTSDLKLIQKIVISNFAAYLHVLATAPYYWVFQALSAPLLANCVIPLSISFLLVPQANRLGFTTLSRQFLLTIINISVYLYTASLGLDSSIQNVFFFTLVSPLMLFRVTEWRSILFCTAQPLVFWALLIWKGSWFIPQARFSHNAYLIMGPSISFTAAILLFGCSFVLAILQQKSESRLEKAKLAAEESNYAKSRFLATMSHEIRTPLNGIFGGIQLLADSNLSLRQKQEFKLMQFSGDLLLTLIDDILDFSNIEAGKLKLEERLFNIHEIATSCKKLIEKNASEKNLSLVLHIAPDCPAWVVGDEARWRQVVMNLANNATKFTKAGGITLRLSQNQAREIDGVAGTEIRMEVQDTGIGMTEISVAKLFQPFSQADSSTTREFGGTGLGLVISKRLATALKGDLTVTTQIGEGSVFCFTSCLKMGSAPILPASVATVSNETKSGLSVMPYTGKKALLVEDNEVNQLVQSKQLESLGFAVTIAANGLEGVERASQVPFNVIFMDCQMPVMDGFEATRVLRQRDLPGSRQLIIAVTANVHSDDQDKCKAVGMDGFIAKPLRMNALKAALEKHLPVTVT